MAVAELGLGCPTQTVTLGSAPSFPELANPLAPPPTLHTVHTLSVQLYLPFSIAIYKRPHRPTHRKGRGKKGQSAKEAVVAAAEAFSNSTKYLPSKNSFRSSKLANKPNVS